MNWGKEMESEREWENEKGMMRKKRRKMRLKSERDDEGKKGKRRWVM